MKHLLTLTAALFIVACSKPTSPEQPPSKGALVMVGGALASSNAEVYQRYIELAGGPLQARVAVIPAASGQPVKYFKQFQSDMVRYGLSEDQIELFPVALKDDRSTPEQDESLWAEGALDEKLAAHLSQFTAVWFLGGDQLNITATLNPDNNGSPLLAAVWALYQRGGVVGGTSAGAAMMSDVMIAAGDSWGALTKGTTDSYAGMQDQEHGPLLLRTGLGFFKQGIIDQHFDRKARFGRLIVATQLHRDSFGLGFGIDENAALIYTAIDNQLQALGAGAVTLVDVRQSQKQDNPHGYHLENIRISVFQGGDKYLLDEHRFVPHAAKQATIGAEYLNLASPVVSGVFSRNSRLKDLLAFDLVDNKGSKEVVSYLHQGSGLGFTLRFTQDELTEGYWQYLDGMLDNGSAYQVKLSIIPSSFAITELPISQP
ncbi:cyanophycinase [Arsukibacterium sp.]|uniref:cyanophycinase n=1 Tax=Arsukibacterium sp. TaxID=1977258 RepID=UPI002FD9F1C1